MEKQNPVEEERRKKKLVVVLSKKIALELQEEGTHDYGMQETKNQKKNKEEVKERTNIPEVMTYRKITSNDMEGIEEVRETTMKDEPEQPEKQIN
ncbi:43393_t:CDS:2 [Gigaspora margarita]|uniref:43393_t:CDS:1 n=1 Tax=Gigaspora margarita TaxID=4874 RepID=A0ABN7W228_GIGMA|nr:43393_t:CDS:2 [Gigaspora margarita]